MTFINYGFILFSKTSKPRLLFPSSFWISLLICKTFEYMGEYKYISVVEVFRSHSFIDVLINGWYLLFYVCRSLSLLHIEAFLTSLVLGFDAVLVG